MSAAEHLHNAPPSHNQVTAVAVIAVLIVLFAVTGFNVLAAVLHRDEVDAQIAELERRAAA